MSFVIDATIFGAWVFSDERNTYSEAALVALTSQKAVVPPLWWYETRNLLIVNELRGRIRSDDTNTFLQEFDKLPIATDQEAQKDIILKLARKGSLSIHEASYLELAARLGCPLATLNKKLAHVAFQEGVSLFKQSAATAATQMASTISNTGSNTGPHAGETPLSPPSGPGLSPGAPSLATSSSAREIPPGLKAPIPPKPSEKIDS